MKKLLGIVLLATVCISHLSPSVYAYELNDRDYDLIEKIDIKVIDLIERKESLTAQKIVDVFEKFLETRETTERFEKILRVIIDDIEYEYYLGEYAEGSISAQDCYEDEYYDEGEQTCVLQDENYDDYDDEENYIDSDQHDEKSEEVGEDENILAKYDIEKNIIILAEGEAQTVHQEVWELFVKIIPLTYRGDFADFKIFDNNESDTAAHVAQNEDNVKQWDLTVNLSGIRNEDGSIDIPGATETLIHEYAHVMTLSKNQMKYIPNDTSDAYWEKMQADCASYFLGEGCLNEESYLNDFIEKFWAQNFEASQDEEEDDFYSGNENNYITEYAATNPGEDIAESFAYFVLQAKPSSENISDQKLLFFYEYPELVKLRAFIRMRIKK